ncbi:MAG TPA: AraC family transcriptional regulator [Candidatus Paceibacterota bacterium]|nr:AraC family transcriptional regulator [Candidatus Paceibacterota bacterium]
MKLIFEALMPGQEEGFVFKEIRVRRHVCPWHFHRENELILTVNCPGYRLVGDDITELDSGDLVLLGSDLPHVWHHEPGERPSAPAHILIIQFTEAFLGWDFWKIPATRPLRQLIKRASAGLRFTGQTRQAVERLMFQMREAGSLRRLVLFLNILEVLAFSSEGQAIVSPGYTAALAPWNQARMERVIQAINQQLDGPIRLNEVARLAGLSEGAFSRFFRLHSGRTFPTFVNQLRIGRACRLLAEDAQKITDIAFACGFTNLSNFNRQFRRIKKMTPREFLSRIRGVDARRSQAICEPVVVAKSGLAHPR